MPNPKILDVFAQLRALQFADLKGARLAASIPVSERLLTALVAASLPPTTKIRDLSVHPQDGNRLTVRIKLPHADFLPPVAVNLLIERQPELPDSPLILRLLTFPAIISMVGAAFSMSSVLPAGIRMEKDRVSIDLKALLERYGYADLIPLIRGVRVRTEEGRMIFEVDAGV